MDLITQHQDAVSRACHNFDVDELYAFGSVLTEKFNPDSDIDFMVSITCSDPLEYAEHYFELKFALEEIFSRKIDLVEQKAIRNEVFKDIVDQQKVLIYAKGSRGLA